MNVTIPSDDEVRDLRAKLKSQAEASGYHLNPDDGLTMDLVRGLLVNGQRYGYQSCPCRLASGKRDEDLDIVCPCYYRDPDLDEFGACYCALYVSAEVLGGGKEVAPVPERRSGGEERAVGEGREGTKELSELAYPVWRCRVCGYLCARNEPPHTCPICKASKERFERFL